MDLNDQVDDHTHLPPPQLVPREPACRIATNAPFAIADSLGNRVLVTIQGYQDWRTCRGQDDERMLFEERNGPVIENTLGSFLFLCAHRPDKGGLLEMMHDGGLRGGLRAG